MTAECWLLEETCDKFVSAHNMDILLPECSAPAKLSFSAFYINTKTHSMLDINGSPVAESLSPRGSAPLRRRSGLRSGAESLLFNSMDMVRQEIAAECAGNKATKAYSRSGWWSNPTELQNEKSITALKQPVISLGQSLSSHVRRTDELLQAINYYHCELYLPLS